MPPRHDIERTTTDRVVPRRHDLPLPPDGITMISFVAFVLVVAQDAPKKSDPPKRQQKGPPPGQAETQRDHKRMMELLGIKELRRGADGMNKNAPNAANT